MAFKDRLVAFFKKYWFGLTCFFLSAAMGIYFYTSSRASREPIFVEDPVKTVIIDSKSVSTSPLKVLTKDNITINGDVTAIRFYFWNKGQLSIKRENILRPILLSLSDPKSRILDYKILNSSRPEIIEPKLQIIGRSPSNSLRLTFNILEQNDGLTGQLIYAGTPAARLEVSGVIEGAKQINTTETVGILQMIMQAAKKLGIILLIAVAMVIFVSLLDVLPGVLKKRFPKLGFTLDVLGWAIVLVFFFSFIYFIVSGFKESVRKDIISSVPKEVKP